MENFAPGLKETILGLTNSLRVIVYFVCVAGLMIQIQQARSDLEGITRPLVRALIVVGLVATLPYWFEYAERVFLSVADTVQDGYTEHPMRTAAKLRQTSSGSTSNFSLRRIGESLYQAFLHAAMESIVLVASFLQVPFLILQYVLKLLCYLFLPVALALFMIPSQASLATRYVQQTLAVLAWPVGFAVTELVAYHLLTAYGNNLAAAYDLVPGTIDAAAFGSLLGGLVAALWLIVGTVGTPLIMQSLICAGTPISGGNGGAVFQQAASLQQVAALIKTLKTGGLAAPAMMAAAGKPGGGAGGGAIPPAGPTPPPPPAPSATPGSDPTGDHRATAALASAQLPRPQTTI
jgi:hypothetical protein